MTPEEFADLVGAPRHEIDRYLSLGLLDPEGDQILDDVDMVRFGYVRARLAQYGNDSEFAAAVRDGRIDSLGRRLFETSTPIEIDAAAMRAGLEQDRLRQLLSALGFSSRNLRESDVDFFEVVHAAQESGLPWEALLDIARVVGDSLRRIADSEMRAVHVYIHERLSAAGVPEEEVTELATGIEQTVAPLMGPCTAWVTTWGTR